MSLLVITSMNEMKEMKEKKRVKTKIGVRSSMKEKVKDMEENTRELRTRIMRKEVVRGFQYVVGKYNFSLLFEDGQKK